MVKLAFGGIKIFNLKRINNPTGDILHIINKDDEGLKNFGEAYFSIINQGQIKGWNKHKYMTINLCVPIGEVKFVVWNGIKNKAKSKFFEINLSPENYFRLMIPPGLWYAFQCLSNYNSLILNVADLKHDPMEQEKVTLTKIPYIW